MRRMTPRNHRSSNSVVVRTAFGAYLVLVGAAGSCKGLFAVESCPFPGVSGEGDSGGTAECWLLGDFAISSRTDEPRHAQFQHQLAFSAGAAGLT